MANDEPDGMARTTPASIMRSASTTITKMRIGYDLTWFPRHKTGVAYYVVRLVREMHRKYSHTVDLHLYVNKYSFNEFNGLEGVTYHHVAGPDALRYFYFQFFFARLLNRTALDIIHFPFYTYFGKIKAKTIITVLDLYYMYDKNCLPNRRGYYYWATLFLKNIKNADLVAAISENTRRDIATFVPTADLNRIRVLYPLLDDRYVPMHDAPHRNQLVERFDLRKPYLLSVGESSVKRRNILQLIRGYARAFGGRYDIDLVLAGISDDREVKTLAMQCGVAEKVHILGYIHEEDLVLLHQYARYCVVPSLYEGFSYPVAQSIKCGIPVIVSRNSCLNEVAGSSAVYIEAPFDDSMITEALLKSEDEELHDELTKNCLDNRRQFDKEYLISRYYKMYEDVTSDHFNAADLSDRGSHSRTLFSLPDVEQRRRL